MGRDEERPGADIAEEEMIRDMLRYIFYKFKYRDQKLSWKGHYIRITVNGVRFKFPTGIHNLEKKSMLYHLRHFEFPNVNLFAIDLPGYFKRYSPKEGDTVIDMGAYSGIFSIYCAMKMKNTGRIIAFEPNIDSIRLLEKAIELNGLTNITIVEKGVWSEESALRFSDKGVCSEIVPSGGDYTIPVIDLDTQLIDMGVDYKDISFIKADIEGAEVEALAGMRQALWQGSPDLAIASYHIRYGKKTCFYLEDSLKKFGYNTVTGYPVHLTTYARKPKETA